MGHTRGLSAPRRTPPSLFYPDVYANRRAQFHDGGLDPEGAVVNNRIWIHTLDGMHYRISLVPIWEGPV